MNAQTKLNSLRPALVTVVLSVALFAVSAPAMLGGQAPTFVACQTAPACGG
jgi:hypothetical protein